VAGDVLLIAGVPDGYRASATADRFRQAHAVAA
jgi:hypothetical protein